MPNHNTNNGHFTLLLFGYKGTEVTALLLGLCWSRCRWCSTRHGPLSLNDDENSNGCAPDRADTCESVRVWLVIRWYPKHQKPDEKEEHWKTKFIALLLFGLFFMLVGKHARNWTLNYCYLFWKQTMMFCTSLNPPSAAYHINTMTQIIKYYILILSNDQ